MPGETFRIGVMAPGSRIEETIAEQVKEIVAAESLRQPLEIEFHPQCFLNSGHFAGDDDTRTAAFLEIANDEGFDALWFARGGYGTCRIAEACAAGLNEAARAKTYLGYSDVGCLLGTLYKAGLAGLAHGPMPIDISRAGGHAAVRRALGYLVEQKLSSIEPNVPTERPAAAFNMAVLSQIIGTPLQPDLRGHVLMLEEVSEHMYRIDRFLFHITSNPAMRRLAGIRLGRCSDIPENDPDFGQDEEEIVRHWCGQSGIPYLGRADIGHDINNRVVPFGPPKLG